MLYCTWYNCTIRIVISQLIFSFFYKDCPYYSVCVHFFKVYAQNNIASILRKYSKSVIFNHIMIHLYHFPDTEKIYL